MVLYKKSKAIILEEVVFLQGEGIEGNLGEISDNAR